MIAQIAADKLARVPVYQPVDVVIAGPRAGVSGNPFDTRFEGTFLGPAGRSVTIPGFYDSRVGFVVRFSPTVEGIWRYRTSSAEGALEGVSGEIEAVPNENERVHGALRVDPEHRHHFRFEDGTRCFLMGYEVDWLMLVDQEPSSLARITRFLEGIEQAGFNLVTVNVYAHNCLAWLTEDQVRDPRYIKPARAPWLGGNDMPNYRRMDPAFWAHWDRVMELLLERGWLAHIMIQVYNKQVNWPELGSEDDLRYWRYVLARYQAFCNVIWDPAKESYYQPPERIWHYLGVIRSLDGYRRLVTVHDANTPGDEREWHRRWYDPRKEYSDALADFKADQIHRDWYRDAWRNYVAQERPYVNIEYGYEEGVDDLPTYNVKQDWREVLRRTWLVTMGGGYINYYYSNTAWNLFVPEPEPPGYPRYRAYRDFWEGTSYWRLTPDNAPLGLEGDEITCRCDPGREYVVFTQAGRAFTLDLGGAGEFAGRWFNPCTGASVPVERAVSDQAFASPWGEGEMAALHLRRRE